MSGEAPAELEIVRGFINTVDLEDGAEELDSPEALLGWLRPRHLVDGEARADGADLARAKALREALRALCRANNGAPSASGSIAVLNDVAARAGVRLRFGGTGGVELAPASSGVDGALGRLLAIVARSMGEGTWARLKACRSEICGWAFYDHSRNRSGAWCSMSACGNRAKARSFRARSRASDSRAASG
ncbi:MAG: CGNR zinc finger domain-containing protein [Gaiellaceae bacterium]